MSRRPEPLLLSEVPAFDDDPALFDPSPEWFVSGLKPSSHDDEADEDGLGLRALIEQPEALAKAWRTTGRERLGNRSHRPWVRHSGRSRRWPHAA
jgi:hypothetical protein